MDYEKKYKEAVNKIKNLLDDGEKNGFTIVTYKTDLESIFPELKESEDELTWLKNYISEEAYSLSMDIRDNDDRIKLKNLQRSLAWLEKQGEQKSKDRYTFNSIPRLLDMIEPTDRAKRYCQKLIDSLLQEGYATDAKIVGGCLRRMNGEDVPMATMDEQKSVDMAKEPKFKVGDWVIGRATSNEPRQISEVTDQCYKSTYGGQYGFSFEDEMRLWTIKDAKDGNVLAASDGSIFIFKEIVDCECKHYIALEKDNETINVNDNLKHFWEAASGVKPATKKQRDLLYSKMKEVGYEWDAEKKELKEISQRMISAEAKEAMYDKPSDKIEPKFKVGDSIKTANEEPLTITEITDNGYWSEDLFICNFDDAAKWELVEQKPADKVEPKFNVGDWVVYYRNDSSREVLQVYDIRDSRYYFTDNVHFSWSVKECDEKSHLWTIQDAKDGDILVCGKEKRPFIFKGLLDKFHPNNPVVYCGINCGNEFCIPVGISWWTDEEIEPATKEQCNLLFQKMKEAGYEWDAENLQLTKILHVKELSDGINIDKQKLAEWSGEDEVKINRIVACLENLNVADNDILLKDVDWLKSLKQRIGG